MTGFSVTKHGYSRFWAVYDPAGELVCVCVYKRGAVEVARRLSLVPPFSASYMREIQTAPERMAVLRGFKESHVDGHFNALILRMARRFRLLR